MNYQYFFLVPLSIIKDFIYKSETIEEMIHVGIYISSREVIKCDKEEAFRNLAYSWYRAEDEIPFSLLDSLKKMEDYPYDENYVGFESDGATYLAEDEVSYLDKYSSGHTQFLADVLEWNCVREFYRRLELSKESIEYTINVGRAYCEHHEIGTKILLNSKVMMNIYESRLSTRAKERAVWAMYMGILSIIGNADYACTTSSMIMCRMFGARDEEELKEFLKDERIATCYRMFCTRHQYRKLLEILQDRDMIREIPLNRRTYVSVKAKTIEDLMNMAISKEIDSKKKRQRDEEKKVQRKRYYEALASMKSERKKGKEA